MSRENCQWACHTGCMEQTPQKSQPSRSLATTAGVGSAAIVGACGYLLCTRRDLAATLSTGANLGVLLVAVLALMFTAAQLAQAREANEQAKLAQKAASEQAEKNSKAAARPYVYASLVPGLWGASSCDLKVENFGKTPARDLVIQASSWPDKEDEHLDKLKRFCETPHTLPPGAAHRLIWFDSRLTEAGSDFGLGEVVDITLTYKDDNGGEWSEKYTCDVAMMQVEPAPSEGATGTGSQDKVLKDINNALRALNVHVGSLRR